MELSVMQEFNEDIINEAAERYGIEKEKLKFINDFENYIYEYEKNDKHYILRLTHSSHRSENLVNGELDWISYLHKNNVNVCNPVLSNNNKLVERIEANNSYFLVTAFDKAKGEHADRNKGLLWNSIVFEKWGQTVGRMHALTKNYSPSKEQYKRFEISEDDLYKNGGTYINIYGEKFSQKHMNLMKWYNSLRRDNNSYGLIHTDVHQGNFFVYDNNITVFDFDDCAYSFFVNDIAIVLFYVIWGMPSTDNKVKFSEEFLKHFMRGYNMENSLEAYWFDAIPKLLKLRELIVFEVLNKKWDLNNLNERQSSLLKDMKSKIENDIPFLDMDFSRFSCTK